jgi:excisionase family DNA binding protein
VSTNNVIPFASAATATASQRAVYSVKEVAEMLALNLGGTYTLIRSGEIPALKLGGRWIVPKARFHAWLDNLPEATLTDVADTFTTAELAAMPVDRRAEVQRYRTGA